MICFLKSIKVHLNSERIILEPENGLFIILKGCKMNILHGLHRWRNDTFITSSSFISGRLLPSVWGIYSFLSPSPSFSLPSSLPPLLPSPPPFLSPPSPSFLSFIPQRLIEFLMNGHLYPREQFPALLGLRASRSRGGKTLQQKHSYSYWKVYLELYANELGFSSCSVSLTDWPWAKLEWICKYLFPLL